MIDLNSKEEALKHLHHIQNTMVNLEEPTTIQKGTYELRVMYLGNTIYYLNTKPFDMTLDEFCKENKEFGGNYE